MKIRSLTNNFKFKFSWLSRIQWISNNLISWQRNGSNGCLWFLKDKKEQLLLTELLLNKSSLMGSWHYRNIHTAYAWVAIVKFSPFFQWNWTAHYAIGNTLYVIYTVSADCHHHFDIRWTSNAVFDKLAKQSDDSFGRDTICMWGYPL